MENKTQRMAVRVTESELKLLKRLAAALDLTVSQYIRLQFEQIYKQAQQLNNTDSR